MDTQIFAALKYLITMIKKALLLSLIIMQSIYAFAIAPKNSTSTTTDIANGNIQTSTLLTRTSTTLYSIQMKENIDTNSVYKRVTFNRDYIEKQKTNLSKKEIEKLLIGTWSFIAIKRIDSLKKIDEVSRDILIDYPNETVKFNQLRFRPNKNKLEPNVEYWSYDEKERIVILKTGTPTYPDDNPDVFANVVKWSQEKTETLLIHKLTNQELIIMELFPISPYENGFKLLLYSKIK